MKQYKLFGNNKKWKKMRKYIILSLALFLDALAIKSANNVVISQVSIPREGTGYITIALNNDSYEFTAFSMTLTLPNGINFVLDEDGCPVFEKSERFSDHAVSSSASGQVGTFACLSLKSTSIKGTNGTLLNIEVVSDGSLAIGTELSATLSEITFTTPSEQEIVFDDIIFAITISQPQKNRTILDETSTIEPEEAFDVDVCVKRIIKANEWSTICLPFAMDESQVKAAFGDDVQLADFDGIETTEDDEENIVGILVKFNTATAIEANHPYVIKVSNRIEEFTADGVDIIPEEDVSIDKDELVIGKGKQKVYYYNKFVGTYIANTDVPNLCLFFNDNKLWYSTGLTKMKAFRGYFDFYEVLTDVEDEYSESKIRYEIDDTTTPITDIKTVNLYDGNVYTIQGFQLGHNLNVKTLPKGVYIVNGQKVNVK